MADAKEPVDPPEEIVPPEELEIPPDPADSPKKDNPKENGAAYEARKARERATALEKELDGYKRRDEDARKSKLTEDQRLKEERDELARENAQLKAERLQSKIAAEFKLPPALAARLIGTDEDSLRADAEELVKFVPRTKVGSPTDPVREDGGKPRIYTRSELQANPKLAASAEVAQAAREGRVIAG